MAKPSSGRTRLIFSVILLTSFILANNHVSEAQRNLEHWRRDLELRLRLYQDQRNDIHSIIASSINYPGRSPALAENVRLASNGNIRFSELIIPTGTLILESRVAKPVIRTLIDRTQSYVLSKLQELDTLKRQLDGINRQLDGGTSQYIYKGQPGVPQPQYNFTGTISGTRIFKQVQFVNLIDSRSVVLPHVNRTNVDQVIDETYLRSAKVSGLVDSEGRLYFEGKKTFLDTVFVKPLRSGCCDRMRPLHTSRMMLRSRDQDVICPIVIQPKNKHTIHGQLPAFIDSLTTAEMSNQIFTIGGPEQYPSVLKPVGMVFQGPPENKIRLENLISLRQLNQSEIFKTLVFQGVVTINQARLSSSPIDNRLVIGLDTLEYPNGNSPNVFDLSHDNYLLRFSNVRNYPYEQFVPGVTVIEAASSFQTGIEASVVNNVPDFARFVNNIIVRVDRPARIEGLVQFITSPEFVYKPDGTLNQFAPVRMFTVQRGLEILRTANGMRLPQDIVVLPSAVGSPAYIQNAQVALKNGQPIYVSGPRRFGTGFSSPAAPGESRVIFDDLVRVSGLVNGMRLPETVIPLHLNDFIGSVGNSNLCFVDGLSVEQLVIQGGKLDEILLRDVYVDAQGLVMHSVFPRQPDGSILIRAPLRVMNLRLFSRNLANHGLLNGFRPQELDLARYGNVLMGRKDFLAPVEATECIFRDINSIPNWTSQLIRVDGPNVIQTVHTRLAFTSSPNMQPNELIEASKPGNLSLVVLNNTNQLQATELSINKLDIEFNTGTRPKYYMENYRFSPEFYMMYQALERHAKGANQTGGRYRCQNVRLLQPNALVNNVALDDIVTVDKPFKFSKQITLVGKVELMPSSYIRADRIRSNYPIDKLDLVQFNAQRISTFGSSAPIKLQNLALGPDNKASFVHTKMLNGILFSEFANSIMSLTRPQTIESELVFEAPVSFEGPLHASGSFNGIKQFREFALRLKRAKYTFEDGLQCNALVLRM